MKQILHALGILLSTWSYESASYQNELTVQGTKTIWKHDI